MVRRRIFCQRRLERFTDAVFHLLSCCIGKGNHKKRVNINRICCPCHFLNDPFNKHSCLACSSRCCHKNVTAIGVNGLFLFFCPLNHLPPPLFLKSFHDLVIF